MQSWPAQMRALSTTILAAEQTFLFTERATTIASLLLPITQTKVAMQLVSTRSRLVPNLIFEAQKSAHESNFLLA